MFVCAIPVVVIATSVATAVPFMYGQKRVDWYLLVLVFSPGWLLAAVLGPGQPSADFLDYRGLGVSFISNFVYWFVLIFGFILWSDRRWRRKRVARLAT